MARCDTGSEREGQGYAELVLGVGGEAFCILWRLGGAPLGAGVALAPCAGFFVAGDAILGRAVCASPFDAAIHDAVGQALQNSAFHFYDKEDEIPSADCYFPNKGAVAAIR
ncbi:MAG: hypothetical protein ACK5LK_07415, partial [Chthoniobacterales bacterium]